ncbi:MAG: hypothetical protein KDN20_05315 [Verrucomicrobiae bacterium]|nr:hypothetical protein [Verrucomicrobiae bacterium]
MSFRVFLFVTMVIRLMVGVTFCMVVIMRRLSFPMAMIAVRLMKFLGLLPIMALAGGKTDHESDADAERQNLAMHAAS